MSNATEETRANNRRGFRTAAGIFLGLGLGGFFDGIILHQVLQWHHMVTSAGYPPNSVANLKFNTLLDGLFHGTTYVFVAIGLALLWRAARGPHVRWSGKMLMGTLLMTFAYTASRVVPSNTASWPMGQARRPRAHCSSRCATGCASVAAGVAA